MQFNGQRHQVVLNPDQSSQLKPTSISMAGIHLVSLLLFLEISSSLMEAKIVLTKTRGNQRATESLEECAINPEDRQVCGHDQISESLCAAIECCWQKGDDKELVASCYHGSSSMKTDCTEATDRVPCPGLEGETSSRGQCLAAGCCWRPDHSDSPETWCYLGKRSQDSADGDAPDVVLCGRPAVPPREFVTSRVIGGDEAVPHSWPWMVSMQLNDTHFCGGSILNEHWILSAAHCYRGLKPNSTESMMVLGVHSLSEEENSQVEIMVDSYVIHHLNVGIEIDLLLIHLSEPIQFTEAISPLCLAQETPPAGERCYSMGWGYDSYTEDDDGQHMTRPDKLLQFVSPIVDRQTCEEAYNSTFPIYESSLCAGWPEGGRGNCMGDSGGPLVCKNGNVWEVVAVVSFGMPCALPNYPTVYADVTKHLDWIANITSNG